MSDLTGSSLPQTLISELEALPDNQLPLQQGLSQSSYVADSPFKVTVLKLTETEKEISLKVGVFYSGIIAGCNCADDPSPADEINEYCELDIQIDRATGQAQISLL
ncbi:MAG: hypothetical protein OEY52_02565 [Gammaproteobacteria bacterium]|nr:hypothetical protein [Gammaproteobacteria bacterium]